MTATSATTSASIPTSLKLPGALKLQLEEDAKQMGMSLHAFMVSTLADAAQRSGVPQDRLRVVRALAVTWPDGSLGCPQPGFSYTQALVPGWQVSIALPSSAASSPALQYHGSHRGGWLHCPADRAAPALPASDDSRI